MSAAVERIFPEPGQTTLAAELGGLDLAAGAGEERPYTVTNFALTVDGAATIGGRAGPIGSRADLELLMRLRSRADAVMIGAGTMRAERYGRIVPGEELRAERTAAGLGEDPLAVLISASLDLPWEAGLFTSGHGEVVVFTSAGADVEPPETSTPLTVIRHEERVDLERALGELRREHGVRGLLCEGGPHLHGELIEAGLVEELFVTTAPKLSGGEGLGLVAGLAEREIGLEPLWLLREPGSGELFARYRVAG